MRKNRQHTKEIVRFLTNSTSFHWSIAFKNSSIPPMGSRDPFNIRCLKIVLLRKRTTVFQRQTKLFECQKWTAIDERRWEIKVSKIKTINYRIDTTKTQSTPRLPATPVCVVCYETQWQQRLKIRKTNLVVILISVYKACNSHLCSQLTTKIPRLQEFNVNSMHCRAIDFFGFWSKFRTDLAFVGVKRTTDAKKHVVHSTDASQQSLDTFRNLHKL